MTKQQLIQALALEPHPYEGGYFCRTYTSGIDAATTPGSSPRKTLSSIFYMLTDDSPIGYLHKNISDIIHYYHSGDPIKYWIINAEGSIEQHTLGADINAGHLLQLTVKGGCWKASELVSGEYGLLSEAVTPGFEYEDMTTADRSTIKKLFPVIYPDIEKLIKR